MANNKIPVDFQFEPIAAMYLIRHKPTKSVYIGVTMDLQRRMRNHISKLRHNKHSCPALQTLFNMDSDLENWEAKILIDGTEEGYDKAKMHELEDEIMYRIPLEVPKMLVLNVYKNQNTHSQILEKIMNRLKGTK